MAQPLVMGAIAVSLLLTGPLVALGVTVILIGGWAVSKSRRSNDFT